MDRIFKEIKERRLSHYRNYVEISRTHSPTNYKIQDWRFEIPFPSLLDVDGDGSSIIIGSTEVFLWDQYTSLAMQTGSDVLGSEVELDKAKDYAAEDADVTFRLYKKFIKN